MLCSRGETGETFEKVCFALIEEGKLVKGSFVGLPFEPFEGSLSLTKSSELLVGERNAPSRGKEFYLSQKYTVSRFCKKTRIT